MRPGPKPSPLTLVAAALAAAVSVSSHAQNLRISQVYIGAGLDGAAYGRDYVELVNVGAGPIDLEGFSIQYAAAGGATWTSRTLSGVAQPGRYFLVSMGTSRSPASAPELPTPDFQVEQTMAMGPLGGKVALFWTSEPLTSGTVCPSVRGDLIDFVACATHANCAEGQPTAAIGAATAAIRIGGGCIDTGNNVTDFVIAPPMPRNSMMAGPGCELPLGADLAVRLEGPPVCPPPMVGAAVRLTATVTNHGPEHAHSVLLVVTVPETLTITGTMPPLSPSGQTLFLPVEALAAGASVVLEIDAVAGAAGNSDAVAAVSTSFGNDPEGLNNTARARVRLLPTPSVDLARAVINTRPGRASPIDPTLPNARLAGRLGPIWFSPSGNRWITAADTELFATTDDAALLVGEGLGWRMVLIENFTIILDGRRVLALGPVQAIDDLGRFAFDADDSLTGSATLPDRFIVKDVGAGLVEVVREGQAVAGIPGATYGDVMGSVSIQADGSVAFYSTLRGVGPTMDAALLAGDGAIRVAQKGVDMPHGQATMPPGTYSMLDAGSGETGFVMNSAGDRWQAAARLNVAVPMDRVLVESGVVSVQENAAVAATFGVRAASPAPITHHRFGGDGASWVIAALEGGDDVVLRDGALVARTGDLAAADSGLRWSDAAHAATFTLAAANAQGDFVVGGVTDHPDAAADGVIVLNGQSVVAREGDPVDLDGDGVWSDDDAYIESFLPFSAALTADRTLYVTVRLRTHAALCQPGSAGDGDALIRIRLGSAAAGACCRGAVCEVVQQVACDGPHRRFAGGGVACNAPGSSTTPCCVADFNQSGDVSVQDIFDFLIAYFAQSSLADANGIGGVTVQDIFDYLNAYFAGGC